MPSFTRTLTLKHLFTVLAGVLCASPALLLAAESVALMGQARGMYTFFGHLRWTPVIALGYIASIMIHMWINAGYFWKQHASA